MTRSGQRTGVNTEPTALSRFGAWGQIGAIGFGVAFWALGTGSGVLAAGIGYFIVTTVGIVGITRTESAIGGPIAYPFVIPGFVPLYYFVTR